MSIGLSPCPIKKRIIGRAKIWRVFPVPNGDALDAQVVRRAGFHVRRNLRNMTWVAAADRYIAPVVCRVQFRFADVENDVQIPASLDSGRTCSIFFPRPDEADVQLGNAVGPVADLQDEFSTFLVSNCKNYVHYF